MHVEEIGSNIIVDMHAQRETILNIKSSVEDSNSTLKQVGRVLRQMAARTWVTKALLHAIIVLLILVILVLIFLV